MRDNFCPFIAKASSFLLKKLVLTGRIFLFYSLWKDSIIHTFGDVGKTIQTTLFVFLSLEMFFLYIHLSKQSISM